MIPDVSVEETLVKDLVILAHNTYQLLQTCHVPAAEARRVADLQESCLNILKLFTVEYGDKKD